jgi:hypothetical protein
MKEIGLLKNYLHFANNVDHDAGTHPSKKLNEVWIFSKPGRKM